MPRTSGAASEAASISNRFAAACTDGDASTCPTVKDLAEAKKLDSKKTDDPWGRPYRISCEDDIVVFSNGKDGKEGTPDDVRNDFKPADIKRVADL